MLDCSECSECSIAQNARVLNFYFQSNFLIRKKTVDFVRDDQGNVNEVYLTSRIKNGNFVVKRWDDKRGMETGDL